MKRLLTFVVHSNSIEFNTAQIPPNAFNYSAVARGPQGQPFQSKHRFDLVF